MQVQTATLPAAVPLGDFFVYLYVPWLPTRWKPDNETDEEVKVRQHQLSTSWPAAAAAAARHHCQCCLIRHA